MHLDSVNSTADVTLALQIEQCNIAATKAKHKTESGLCVNDMPEKAGATAFTGQKSDAQIATPAIAS